MKLLWLKVGDFAQQGVPEQRSFRQRKSHQPTNGETPQKDLQHLQTEENLRVIQE